MRFDCLTLFPDMMKAVLNESIIGRAVNQNLLEINYINIRDFAQNKHNTIDDAPYGGGSGMVMQAMPIYLACRSITDGLTYQPKMIYMSPQGKVFNQKMAVELSKEQHLIFLCGHYEGIDERVIEEIVDMEISIGDFVLTGGEIPAMAVIDSIARMLPGVLAGEESFSEESHFNGLLEYPQYTRPPEFLGRKVPDVLLSGHHKNIETWRREQSIYRTYQKRKDMLQAAELSQKERDLINKWEAQEAHEYERKND